MTKKESVLAGEIGIESVRMRINLGEQFTTK